MDPLLCRGVGGEDLGRGLPRPPLGVLAGGPRGGRVLGSALQLREGFKNSSAIDKWNRPLIFTPPTH